MKILLSITILLVIYYSYIVHAKGGYQHFQSKSNDLCSVSERSCIDDKTGQFENDELQNLLISDYMPFTIKHFPVVSLIFDDDADNSSNLVNNRLHSSLQSKCKRLIVRSSNKLASSLHKTQSIRNQHINDIKENLLIFHRRKFKSNKFHNELLSKSPTLSSIQDRLLNIRGGYHSRIPLPIFKGLLQLALTMITILTWLLPLHSKNFHNNSSFLQYGNSFAGGVFLMLGIGHMIPSSMESLAKIGISSTLTFYFVMLGYALILFIEKVAFNIDEMMHDKAKTTEVQSNSPKILTLALSVHSLFETLALGLASDGAAATVLAASIGLHQPAESLALLITFLKSSTNKKDIIKWLTSYSFMGPIGVLGGILIKKLADPVAEGLILAVTAGTFLYVGATEVIGEEFEGDIKRSERFLRFGSFVCGMATLALLQLITDKWEQSLK